MHYAERAPFSPYKVGGESVPRDRLVSIPGLIFQARSVANSSDMCDVR